MKSSLRGSLLVVDDEARIVSSIKRLFRGSGVEVFGASSGLEGLEVLRKSPVGCIISDIRMPDMDGTEFLEKASRISPRVPRIILTGYPDIELARKAVNELEVYSLLTKPWDNRNLLNTVRSAMEYFELEEKNRKLLHMTQERNFQMRRFNESLYSEVNERTKKIFRSLQVQKMKKERLDALAELIRDMNSCGTIEEMYEALESGVRKIVPCDELRILLLPQSGDSPRMVVRRGESIVIEKNAKIDRAFRENSLWELKGPLAASRVSDISRLAASGLVSDKKLASVIMYPLFPPAMSDPIGILNMSSYKRHVYGDMEIESLMDISGSLAVAIQKFSILEDIVRAGREWQETFSTIGDPMMLLDSSRNVLGFNRAAEEICIEPGGSKCHQRMAGSNDVCKGCPVFGDSEEPGHVPGEVEVGNDSGKYECIHFPVKTSDGPEKVIVCYRNISLENELYGKLIQREKMAALGVLAGSIAHELNNPLGGILAFSQILKEELGPEETHYADIQEIESACLRCKDIISNFIGFARAESVTNIGVLDVNEVVEKTLPLLKSALTGVEIKMDFSQILPGVRGNHGELQQVFFNLMNNACQEMHDGGVLTLRTGLLKGDDGAEKGVVVAVEDTGGGISDEDVAKIFEPFYSTKKKDGTGLGLAVANDIVKKMGGEITVESMASRGTIFSVCLPLAGDA